MSWAKADWSPIADQIRSFGTGLANVALRKQQLQRQLGKDLVDYDVANANMDLTRAKTQREQMDMDNIGRLASMFDPGTLTPEQRTGLAANTMAGKNIFADALRGAKLGQEAAQAKELFDNGTPVERLSIVTGSAVKPYALNGKTGAVINQMTGEVTADTPVAMRVLRGGAGGGAGGINFKRYEPLYSYQETIEMPGYGPKQVTRVDYQQMARDLYDLLSGGQISDEGVLRKVAERYGTSPTSSAPAANVSDGVRAAVAKYVTDPKLQGKLGLLGQDLANGNITYAEFVEQLRQMGIE